MVIVAGSTVLCYQYLMGLDGIYWFVPVCTSCLVIGLTIDYDVFLIRHRTPPPPHTAAIVIWMPASMGPFELPISVVFTL